MFCAYLCVLVTGFVLVHMLCFPPAVLTDAELFSVLVLFFLRVFFGTIVGVLLVFFFAISADNLFSLRLLLFCAGLKVLIACRIDIFAHAMFFPTLLSGVEFFLRYICFFFSFF